MTKLLRNLLLSVFILIGPTSYKYLNAQASLSIQGILKKSNGLAVDDGSYTISFRLYNTDTGPTSAALWTETKNNVEVFNGIYSAILGDSTALDVPFDELYYLGVTIGATELTPRILLTSAPYALSLIGLTNQFPSSGEITADGAKINGGVKVNGGIPGQGGVNGNGYAFEGNNGDNDSGMFSTADGKVSLYSDNVEKLAVSPTKVEINGNLDIINDGAIKYDDNSDWRLVEIDYFEANSEGWNAYQKTGSELIGWDNDTPTSISPTDFSGDAGFVGKLLRPTNNTDVLKKKFTINTSNVPYSYIKVKFKYHFIDSWDTEPNDMGFAGFAENATGTNLRLTWNSRKPGPNIGNPSLNTPAFKTATNYYTGSNSQNIVEQTEDVVMIGKANSASNDFWVFIGAALSEDANNESYGIGFIEVWVK